MLDEARELIKSATDDLSLEWCIKREDWLARYEQRREMVIKIQPLTSDGDMWYWFNDDFGTIKDFDSREVAIADARRVADELGLRMKVEGE